MRRKARLEDELRTHIRAMQDEIVHLRRANAQLAEDSTHVMELKSKIYDLTCDVADERQRVAVLVEGISKVARWTLGRDSQQDIYQALKRTLKDAERIEAQHDFDDVSEQHSQSSQASGDSGNGAELFVAVEENEVA